MTFLPIVTRELQVRARSRGTYWTRFAVALASMLVCLPQLVYQGSFGGMPLGRALFNGLVTAAFMITCAACFLTADIISSERREGTLGLLLLTRVNGLDLLAGKLGSAGLTSLCALVAFLPMLMITVLAGGVTGGEAFRKELVLLDTLFLAMAAGLWSSARGRAWGKNSRDALVVMAVIVLVPPLMWGLALRGRFGVFALIEAFSPLTAMKAAADTVYKFSVSDYWGSLLCVQLAAWMLLLGAGVRLRRMWRQERASDSTAAPDTVALLRAKVARPPRQPVDTDPIAWRLQRQRGLKAILWAAALADVSQHWGLLFMLRLIRPSSAWVVMTPFSLAMSLLSGALFAWGASRFFVEARRSGELELLLSTPVGARRIVAAQSDVLMRVLRWPVVVMILPSLLQVAFCLVTLGTSYGQSSFHSLQYAVAQLIGCANIILGVAALCWLGLWFGLRAGGQGRAVAWTVIIGRGLPYLVSMLTWVILGLSRSFAGLTSSTYWVIAWLPQLVNLLLYLGLIRFARRRLLSSLASCEPMALDLRQSASAAIAFLRKARHWTPS